MRARLLGLALAAAGCAGEGTQLRAEVSPSFHPAGADLSVVGVYRDGRMNDKSWDEVGPQILAALAGAPCEVGFGERLETEQPEVYSKLDQATRDDGLSAETLAAIAPRAKGRYLLVLQVYDRPLRSEGKRSPSPSPAPSQGMRGGGRRGGGGGGRGFRGGGAAPSGASEEAQPFSAELSVFSIEAHDLVARVSIDDLHDTTDEALAKLAAKVREVLPGAACVGWK